MKSLVVVVVLSLAMLTDDASAQPSEGTLVRVTVPAPSLQKSLFATPTEQPAAVYLPPSYNKSDRRYPVVYFLPGFGDLIYYYTNYGVYQGFSLRV